ncbi:MAG: DUF3459 domain-containing protein, partial [bacterium]|nr:DUF3459 domain-containing protein [bacterium]
RLREHIRRLIALRQSSPAWRTGGFAPLCAEGSVVAYARWDEERTFLVALNAGKALWQGEVPLRTRAVRGVLALQDVWSETVYPVSRRRVALSLPARSFLILESVP